MKSARKNQRQSSEKENNIDPETENSTLSLAFEAQSALLSTVFAHSAHGMAFFDPGLVIRAANVAFANQIHIPLDQLIGKFVPNVIEGWLEQVGWIYEKVRDSGKPFQADSLPFVFKDHPEWGVTYWSGSLSPVYEPHGTFFGYLLVQLEVTERVRMEEALRESEERFRQKTTELETIFQALPDLYFQLAPDGTILDYRAGRPSDLFVQPEEFLGKRVQAVLPDNVGLQMAKAIREVTKTKSPVTLEYSLPLPTGEQFFEARFLPMLEDTHIIVVVRNISELRRVEEQRTKLAQEQAARAEAEETSHFLQVILDAIPVPIFYKDAEGVYQGCNIAFQEMLGLPKDQIVGRTVYGVNPEELANVFRQADLELIHRGGIQVYETKVLFGDGIQHDVEFHKATFNNPDGSTGGLVGTIFDITERKRANAERERLLAEVQRRVAELDTVITSVPDGLILYGNSGEVLLMNPVAEKIFGFTPEELRLPLAQRMSLRRAETPDGKPFPPHEHPVSRALRGELAQGIVMVAHRPDRTIWLSVSAAPIRAADGAMLGVVSINTDITALHELQEQREDFIRTVSHDLRAPLTIVQGQAQVMQRILASAGHDGIERRSVDAIAKSARRMNAMIQDLVDSVRLEARQIRFNIQPLDLHAILLDLMERFRGIIDTERIKIEIPPGLPRVEADPDRLERILVNLLSNALKYSSPETEVLVEAEKTDSQVVIAITDRGIGIAPEDLPHLFERYYRATGARRTEGLGLGLYITKMLVEGQGGQIWVTSEPGRGSTFYFSLQAA